MKKVIFALLLLVGFATSNVQAQDNKEKTKKEQTDKKEGGQKLKKDGTPDMRYKENKEAAKEKPTGPTKKDGTPDMRYKENKEKAKK